MSMIVYQLTSLYSYKEVHSSKQDHFTMYAACEIYSNTRACNYSTGYVLSWKMLFMINGPLILTNFIMYICRIMSWWNCCQQRVQDVNTGDTVTFIAASV